MENHFTVTARKMCTYVALALTKHASAVGLLILAQFMIPVYLFASTYVLICRHTLRYL